MRLPLGSMKALMLLRFKGLLVEADTSTRQSHHVTVCICTYDRGASIVSTLESVLHSTHADFDIVVVDQSRSNETAEAVQRLIGGDARCRYIHSTTAGAAAARNVAISHATGPIVAFTDDDCEVPPTWLRSIIDSFDRYPHVGEVCGAVHVGPHDSAAGFVPDHAVERHRLITSPWLKWRDRGIGANMAFRLEALQAAGRFDELLGPGAPLFSCEEGDMAYRVLKAGYAVLDTPNVSVIHHGFRSWQEGQALMWRTGIGVGAAYMKHMRLGDMAIIPTLLIEWIRCISWSRLLLLRKRNGLNRFRAYAHGMKLCFRYGIDRTKHLYIGNDVVTGETHPYMT